MQRKLVTPESLGACVTMVPAGQVPATQYVKPCGPLRMKPERLQPRAAALTPIGRKGRRRLRRGAERGLVGGLVARPQLSFRHAHLLGEHELAAERRVGHRA